MATRKRLRWTAILCCHALANLASYRAGWNGKQLAREEAFWKRANGNFMDVAVLEWCKLFADRRGVHSYRNVLTDPAGFESELLGHLGMSAADFETYCTGVKTYRDKFVAHLDDDPKAKYPQLDVAIKSAKFLYNYLRTQEDKNGYLDGLPRKSETAYRLALSEAKASYGSE
jgi:hypothetical protein